MARHGENIRKRIDGRWEGRYLIYSEEKGKHIYRSIYGRTYEEVREKLTTQKNLLIKDQMRKTAACKEQLNPVVNDITFLQVTEEWLADVKENRKQSTYIKYNLIVKKYLQNFFQKTLLMELTDSYVREKIVDDLSNSVQKSIYCALNQILKYASQKYSITMPYLKKPPADLHSSPVKVLAKNEQKKIISILYQEMDRFKMAILLCLFTGLRLGELCALKWEDIDFENKILMVNRTVQRLYVEGCKTKTKLVETPPKSEYSKREIPLPAAILELLISFQNNKDYIFGGKKPMEPRTLQYHFKQILADAGLPDKNFHILRHTFSTNCIEGGTDVKSLSEMLGHADVQITLNRYVHPSMEAKRQYMDGLSEFYGQIRGQAG